MSSSIGGSEQDEPRQSAQHREASVKTYDEIKRFLGRRRELRLQLRRFDERLPALVVAAAHEVPRRHARSTSRRWSLQLQRSRRYRQGNAAARPKGTASADHYRQYIPIPKGEALYKQLARFLDILYVTQKEYAGR
jgi:hypothetical protein